MKIIADENIPYVSEVFTTLGDVVLRPGRGISAEDVRDAEMLLVRSVTQVNEALLAASSIRFVATATIGEDHIDRRYLADRKIGFSSAPGCNANSVGEYLVAALLHLEKKYALQLDGMSLGVIGVGNVGSNVAQKAAALGMTVVLNDPPRADGTHDPIFRPLDELYDCDIITTHVPITKDGPHPTWHLVDDVFLNRLKPGAIVINTARGPVVDNTALLGALQRQHIQAAVLDVWEGEPDVMLDLLDAVDLASPHIAGYSFDGKVKGTVQIYEAACAFLEKPATWSPTAQLPAPEHPAFTVDGSADFLKTVVDTVYPILEDDGRMRGIKAEAPEARRAYFDMLRKTYPRRREFYNTQIDACGAAPALVTTLRGLGFTIRG